MAIGGVYCHHSSLTTFPQSRNSGLLKKGNSHGLIKPHSLENTSTQFSRVICIPVIFEREIADFTIVPFLCPLCKTGKGEGFTNAGLGLMRTPPLHVGIQGSIAFPHVPKLRQSTLCNHLILAAEQQGIIDLRTI